MSIEKAKECIRLLSTMVDGGEKHSEQSRQIEREALAELAVKPEAKCETGEDGCICQKCKGHYKIDLLLPDELWKRISPKKVEGFKGGGLLCPRCIIEKLEGLNEFAAFCLLYPDIPSTIERQATELTEDAEIIHRLKETIFHELAKNKQLKAELTKAKEDMKRLREENRWIPISERLPKEKESDKVLFIIDEGFAEGGEFKNGLFWSNGGRAFNNVTHWKPIILPNQALNDVTEG